MKISQVVLLSFFLSSSAFAMQVSVTDTINLSEAANSKHRDLSGSMPVTLTASSVYTNLKMSGYKGIVECVEMGPETIPGYPETADCVKQQQTWVPQVVVQTTKNYVVADVGGKSRQLALDTQVELPASCIKNLSQVTLISAQAPNAQPAELVIDKNCEGSRHVGTYNTNLKDSGDLKFKPAAMKKESVLLRLSLSVFTKLNAVQDIKLGAYQVLPVSPLETRIVVGQADLSSDAFQYVERLFVR